MGDAASLATSRPAKLGFAEDPAARPLPLVGMPYATEMRNRVALDMADGIIAVARQMIERPKASALRGVFHLVGSGEATWAEFADAVFAESRAVGGPSARVIPIPSSAYPTPARRPASPPASASTRNCSASTPGTTAGSTPT